MVYEIVWDESGLDDLKDIENSIRKRIITKVRSIEEHPFRFVDRLSGFIFFKLRIGDYRVVLDIQSKINRMVVILVGHRSKVYAELGRRVARY